MRSEEEKIKYLKSEPEPNPKTRLEESNNPKPDEEKFCLRYLDGSSSRKFIYYQI